MLMSHVEVLRTGSARGRIECDLFEELVELGFLDTDGEKTPKGFRLLSDVQTMLREIDLKNYKEE